MILDGNKNPQRIVAEVNSKNQVEDDNEEENTSIVVAFIVSVRSKSIVYDDGESNDEGILDEDVVEAFKLLHYN